MRSTSTQLPRAFTVPEMLAVVAIIAIIVSMLMPALGKAKEAARLAICKSNMRQFSNANNVYSVQNGGWMLPIRDPDGDFWMWNLEFRGLLGLGAGADFPPDIRCPSLELDAVGSGGQQHNFYGWNRTPLDWGVLPIMFKRTSINGASSKAQMVDGTDWHIWITYADYSVNWDVFRHTRLWSVAYRHNEGTNIVHFDSHVEYFTKQRAWPVDTNLRTELWNMFP